MNKAEVLERGIAEHQMGPALRGGAGQRIAHLLSKVVPPIKRAVAQPGAGLAGFGHNGAVAHREAPSPACSQPASYHDCSRSLAATLARDTAALSSTPWSASWRIRVASRPAAR